MSEEFNVIKRNGQVVPVQFDEISIRNKQLVNDLGLKINIARLTQTVSQGLKNNITTEEIDHLSSETAASLSVYEPEYDILAARIFMDNLHKTTPYTFSECFEILNKDGIIHPDVYSFFKQHTEEIEKAIDHSRDFQYSFFACKTLERSYLFRHDKKTVERPQYMLMRVSLGIHYKGTVEDVLETYNMMSTLMFTHASPTMFNGGTNSSQLSSCFLLGMEDSLDGIYKKLHETAMISKFGGGIGINISNIRSKGSTIHSVGGVSDGIIPMIKVFNETARYVNQSGKRKGSIAMYLEPWHPETMHFLELRLNNGKEEMRARDIFIALWVPDLFMKRVKANSTWSFFDPYTIKKHYGKGLEDIYGDEFETLYHQAEQDGLATETLKAQDVWVRILQSQIETGTPYLLYKDSVNKKSNQQNIGIIRGSNLCAEILEYTDSQHTSVCNLASIALNQFVKNGQYQYEELGKIVRILVRNLNRIIDNNFYPSEFAKETNLSHRPVGIGIQGLHDVFCLLKCPWDSAEAKEINRKIFETIYYHAVDESAELATVYGSYNKFEGSPLSQGVLQCDMWNSKPITGYNWDELREKVKKGVRNSLLISLMPTATTSQILGNTEAFEPVTSNLYKRKVLAGDFPVINKHLYQALSEKGLWTKKMVDDIIRENGSIQSLSAIPESIRVMFRTVWELSMKNIIDMAADRAPFVDQTQSMNLFMASPTISKLTSMHFYAWEKGLKTGCYYLRSKPRVEAVKFTLLEDSIEKRFTQKEEETVCESCSA